MDTVAQSDSVLLRRYASGADAQAMAELVRRHAGMVFGVARRITRDADDAEDVAQSCFLELIRSADRLPQERASTATGGSAAGWLHRTAVHRALDILRNNHTRRQHERQSARQRATVEQTALWWEQIAPQVDAAIEALPEELREPLILHYLQGRPQAQVAKLLGVSQPTVSRRLEQAVQELRRRLRGDEPESWHPLLGAILLERAVVQPPATLTAALGKMAVVGIGTAASPLPAAGAVGAAQFSLALIAKWVAAAALLTATLGGAVWFMVAQRPGSPSPAAQTVPIRPAAHPRVAGDDEKVLLPSNNVLQVSDVAASAAWFRDRLGYVIASQTADAATVQRDECTIVLGSAGPALPRLVIPVAERDDIDDLNVEFRRRQASPDAPQAADPDRYELTVHDPDHHELIFQYRKQAGDFAGGAGASPARSSQEQRSQR